MATLIAHPQRTSSHEMVEVVQAKSAEFNWVFFAVIPTFHLGAVAALFTFHWSSVRVSRDVALWPERGHFHQLSSPAYSSRFHHT